MAKSVKLLKEVKNRILITLYFKMRSDAKQFMQISHEINKSGAKVFSVDFDVISIVIQCKKNFCRNSITVRENAP